MADNRNVHNHSNLFIANETFNMNLNANFVLRVRENLGSR